jgi:hypothetical protein
MAHTYAPHIHLPHVQPVRLFLVAVVVLGIAIAGLLASQIDFSSQGGGSTQTGQPAISGTPITFEEFYTGLSSREPPQGQAVTCTGGGGLECLLGFPR